MARLGYAAKGVVYVLIGMMAMLVALGRKRQPVDFSEVLIQVVREPFGRLLLALLTIGLACYGLWCLVQAVLDTENKGTSFFAIVTRLLYAAVGFVYLALAWSAGRLITGAGSVRPGDRPEQEWAASFLALTPYGQWLVAFVGAGFIGSVSTSFTEPIRTVLKFSKLKEQHAKQKTSWPCGSPKSALPRARLYSQLLASF